MLCSELSHIFQVLLKDYTRIELSYNQWYRLLRQWDNRKWHHFKNLNLSDEVLLSINTILRSVSNGCPLGQWARNEYQITTCITVISEKRLKVVINRCVANDNPNIPLTIVIKGIHKGFFVFDVVSVWCSCLGGFQHNLNRMCGGQWTL